MVAACYPAAHSCETPVFFRSQTRNTRVGVAATWRACCFQTTPASRKRLKWRQRQGVRLHLFPKNNPNTFPIWWVGYCTVRGCIYAWLSSWQGAAGAPGDFPDFVRLAEEQQAALLRLAEVSWSGTCQASGVTRRDVTVSR